MSHTQGLLGKMPQQITKILRLPVWNGIMDRFLRLAAYEIDIWCLVGHGPLTLDIPSDEFASYTGETLVPQKSGYMLNATTAIRLVPGAKAQPLHRVRQCQTCLKRTGFG